MFELSNAIVGIVKGIYGLYMYYDTAKAWKSVKHLGSTLKRKTFGIISTVWETFNELMLKKIGVNNVPFKSQIQEMLDKQSYNKEQKKRNKKKYRK